VRALEFNVISFRIKLADLKLNTRFEQRGTELEIIISVSSATAGSLSSTPFPRSQVLKHHHCRKLYFLVMFSRNSVLTGHVLYVATCLFSLLFANYGILECDTTGKYQAGHIRRACPAFQYNPRAARGVFESDATCGIFEPARIHLSGSTMPTVISLKSSLFL